MSYTTLFKVGRDGLVRSDLEMSNSRGYAARIWTDLYDKYLKDLDKEYDSWMVGEDCERLWALGKDARLCSFERDSLISTFDNVMIMREDFGQMSVSLCWFVKKYPPKNRVCHLLTVASRLDELSKDDSVQAVCFHQTSVTANPWVDPCQESEDHAEPYNINKGTKHWFLDFGSEQGKWVNKWAGKFRMFGWC